MSLEYYKRKMIDLRGDLQKEKERKKSDNERYAALVRSASSQSSKDSYRKQKVSAAASHDRTIERIKSNIDSCKDSIARERAKKK